MTLSGGGAIHVATRGPSDTFKATDRALYSAKERGRDCLVVETAPAPVEELAS